ncbi:MAG: hypothetical protein IPJ62_18125 [Betaproteobacteria bacterium]|nr:hypothetical protein [Betaproteobacteria bacterium]
MNGIAWGWRILSRIVALGWALTLPAVAADAGRTVHGSSDAYAEAGIALAWGVRRGADEATTRVTLRIVADPARYPRVEAAGRDPFTQAERVLLTPAATKVSPTSRFRAPISPTSRAPSCASTGRWRGGRRLFPRRAGHDAGVRLRRRARPIPRQRIARARGTAGGKP